MNDFAAIATDMQARAQANGFSLSPPRNSASQANPASPRPPANLDGIFGQIGGLLEQATRSAALVHDIADRLLGSSPECVGNAKSGVGPEGMLSAIQSRLDALESALSHIEYDAVRLTNI